ncbi:MAG: hypothetical protein AB1656_04535 [Candidatus Omnitrophota bacterium]
MGSAIDLLRKRVKREGQVPISLDIDYAVIFSSLQGNLPINNQAKGTIGDIPVELQFEHSIVPNTMGSFPINTLLTGMIGDDPVRAKMTYKIVFSTIAGNIPVNTGISWKHEGKEYFLTMPYTLVPAAARGGGAGSGGSTGRKAKRVFTPKFSRGKMIQVDEVISGSGGPSQEAGRPICKGIFGMIDDIEVNLQFDYTYYINTSSGRNPINIRAKGYLAPASPQ